IAPACTARVDILAKIDTACSLMRGTSTSMAARYCEREGRLDAQPIPEYRSGRSSRGCLAGCGVGHWAVNCARGRQR
ncbi:MAG: hypothetical protein ACKN9D_11090, partial [Actinomycetales bacterium]